MASLIVWCVGLILVVVLTVVLAEAGYGFDEKRAKVLIRGKGKQYDHFSEVVIEIAIVIHMAAIFITSALFESQLFEQMVSENSETGVILYPILGCAYAVFLCLVCLLLYSAIKRAKHRRLIEKKNHLKDNCSTV